MSNIIDRKCPFCGGNLSEEHYSKMPNIQFIAYCNNEGCEKFCTDATCPSKRLSELEAVEDVYYGDCK